MKRFFRFFQQSGLSISSMLTSMFFALLVEAAQQIWEKKNQLFSIKIFLTQLLIVSIDTPLNGFLSVIMRCSLFKPTCLSHENTMGPGWSSVATAGYAEYWVDHSGTAITAFVLSLWIFTNIQLTRLPSKREGSDSHCFWFWMPRHISIQLLINFSSEEICVWFSKFFNNFMKKSRIEFPFSSILGSRLLIYLNIDCSWYMCCWNLQLVFITKNSISYRQYYCKFEISCPTCCWHYSSDIITHNPDM